jgi:hypothetical protein
MVSLLCLAAGISFDMYIFSTIILYFFSMIWLLNNFTFSIFILLDKRICTTGPRIVANYFVFAFFEHVSMMEENDPDLFPGPSFLLLLRIHLIFF